MMRFVIVALLGLITIQGFSQDSERPKQPDLPGDLMLDFGVNLWSKDPDLLPTKPVGSTSFGVYYTKRNPISEHFSFYTALGFSFETISFRNRNSWFRDPDGAVTVDSLPNNVLLRNNKLRVTYFEIPLELRVHPFGTVKGEGFFIGLGVIGGVRIGAKTKVKYDIEELTYKEQLSGDFDLNRWKYGVQARLGFKTVHLFYKMYLSDQFANQPYDGATNPRMMTIGINFSGF